MIPHSVKLGEVVDVLSGFAFKSEFFNKADGLPVVRIRDVVRGYTDTFYTGSYAEQFVVSDGDILIGMDGNFNAAKWRGGRALLNQRVCKVTAKASLLDEAYLFHYLPTVLKKIEDATPFVTVKHLSAGDLRDEKIPLPSLLEQRRIAAILDKAVALRAKCRETLVQLDRLAQSIFLNMFGDPATNPKGWERKQLGELVVEGDSINYGVIQPGDDVEHGVPLVRVGDLGAGRVQHEALKRIAPEVERAHQRSRLKGDEILVSCVGSVGFIALASHRERGFNIARAIARVRVGNKADREFVAAQLGTDAVQRYFTQELRTVSQPTLNIKQISETQMICPPLELQQGFASRVRAVREARTRLVDGASLADALFESARHRAFRGKLW